MVEKRFTTWGNRIKRNGKLLNIEFKTKTDAKLCCKLCSQMDKHKQEYIDELDEIFKWYKEYYGETILDTKMQWNDDNKISKLEKENEQLKQQVRNISDQRNEFHRGARENANRVGKLEKENEQLKEENQQLRTLNYVNKEAVRLNNIKYVQIGKENVDCSKIDWKLLYELYRNMIDYYYNEVLE